MRNNTALFDGSFAANNVLLNVEALACVASFQIHMGCSGFVTLHDENLGLVGINSFICGCWLN